MVEQLEGPRKYAFTLEESVKSSDEYAESLAAAMEEKDAFIKGFDESIAEENTYINDLQQAIASKDEYIGSLVSILNAKKHQLDKSFDYNKSLLAAINEVEQAKDEVEKLLQNEIDKSIGQLVVERLKQLTRK